MPAGQSRDRASRTPTYHAPKDKHCPYCAQAFTASSLGRHLDFYIREKNPKPPDGVHDVAAIRQLRGTITRRKSKAPVEGRRDISSPSHTPKESARDERASWGETRDSGPHPNREAGQHVVDTSLGHRALNSIHTGDMDDGTDATATPCVVDKPRDRRPSLQRSISRRTAQRARLDAKQRLSEAVDMARAAELAFRELLSSVRAANPQIPGNHPTPFSFDPLSLDFPALTLQCLHPPPTLYSSTQHPTSTSWSVQSPGRRELGALKSYFQAAFKAWKCSSAATATPAADQGWPCLPEGAAHTDVPWTPALAGDDLETQVHEHLRSAYDVWEQLPAQRRHELWILELARSVGRKHKENEQLKDQMSSMRQEAAHLASRIDGLNGLPNNGGCGRLSPLLSPLGQDVLASTRRRPDARRVHMVGSDLAYLHEDITTVATKSIERWRRAVTAMRTSSAGMGAQKALEPDHTQDAVDKDEPSTAPTASTPKVWQTIETAMCS